MTSLIRTKKAIRRTAFDQAAESIGLPGLHPHELRHTAVSLAIAAGANVKVIQQMLGHKSATMTLDQYGHLFGDQLDQVADALNAAVLAAQSQPLALGAPAGRVVVGDRPAMRSTLL